MTSFISKSLKTSITTLAVGILTIASFATLSPQAFAAGLEPYNADKANPDSLRFVFNLNAGESVQDAARVTNNTNQPVNVEVLGRDGEITSDGQLTVVSNSLENQQSGKWISLDQTKYTVKANDNIKVPFKVSVPADTKSGEYYAGLSVIELGDANNTTSGNVTVKTRLAVKVFITVKGDLKANTDVKNLNIIDPKDTDYNIERAKYGKIGRDNMFIRSEAENTGNIFLKLNSKYKVTLPDGTVKEFTKDQDLAPGIGSKKFYLETALPFQVGKTKVELTYEAKPTNTVKDGNNLKTETVKGTLTDELNLSQADYDNFVQSRAAQIQTATQDNAKKEPIEVKVVQESNTNKLLLGAVIVLLVGIVGMQIYSIIKKNKSTKNEDTTTAK
jgi:hypothetical protein